LTIQPFSSSLSFFSFSSLSLLSSLLQQEAVAVPMEMARPGCVVEGSGGRCGGVVMRTQGCCSDGWLDSGLSRGEASGSNLDESSLGSMAGQRQRRGTGGAVMEMRSPVVELAHGEERAA
jgi:hypothetical protein